MSLKCQIFLMNWLYFVSPWQLGVHWMGEWDVRLTFSLYKLVADV